jgi:FkbM family methyltransferase
MRWPWSRRADDDMPVIPLNLVYDTLTQQVVREVLCPGRIGIDVGAHQGDILSHMVAAAPGEPHIAIEPLPAFAALLRRRYPSAEVHEVALDATGAGEVSFHHVVSNPSYSGLRERRYDRPHETVELITVRTARLDELVPDDRQVGLVKIDVEGGELGVMQGAERTLSRHRPVVVFEHGLGGSDFYGTRPEVVYDLLDDHGLQVSLLQRYTSGAVALTRNEFVEQFETGANYYFVAYLSAAAG